jgi:hypothetical protein
MCQYKCVLESGGNGWMVYNLKANLKKKYGILKSKFSPKNGNAVTAKKKILANTEKINLSVGDYVRVRPREEIAEMMDNNGYKCPIMGEMYEDCEKIFKVVREVKYFYDEVKGKFCKCKNIYLLEGSHCSGSKFSFPEACDLNCFFFWHKDWLEKV